MTFTKAQLAAIERLAFTASMSTNLQRVKDGEMVLTALEADYKEVQSHR